MGPGSLTPGSPPAVPAPPASPRCKIFLYSRKLWKVPGAAQVCLTETQVHVQGRDMLRARHQVSPQSTLLSPQPRLRPHPLPCVQPCTCIHKTLLPPCVQPHACTHTHKHCAPTRAASPACPYKASCGRQRPRKWCFGGPQLRSAGLMGTFLSTSGASGLGQHWHPAWLEPFITIHTTDHKTEKWE